MHRTQVSLEEEQYRWLRQQAGRTGSIAAVVRRLIDEERARPVDARRDPAIRHLLSDAAPPASRAQTSVTTLDDTLYGR